MLLSKPKHKPSSHWVMERIQEECIVLVETSQLLLMKVENYDIPESLKPRFNKLNTAFDKRKVPNTVAQWNRELASLGRTLKKIAKLFVDCADHFFNQYNEKGPVLRYHLRVECENRILVTEVMLGDMMGLEPWANKHGVKRDETIKKIKDKMEAAKQCADCEELGKIVVYSANKLVSLGKKFARDFMAGKATA